MVMSENRKKVIFFTPGSVGGAERQTLTIAKSLPKDEYEVTIVFLCKRIGNLVSFIPDDLKTHHLKIRNIYDFATLRIMLFLRKEKPYAVFSSLSHINVRLAAAAKLAGVQRIIVRNDLNWDKWSGLTRNLSKLSYRFADAIICQTEDMRQSFICEYPKIAGKFVNVPNLMDFDTIHRCLAEDGSNPLDPSCVNFVYSGRISPDKGTDVLLAAFAKVVEKIDYARLIIVGKYDFLPDYYNGLLHDFKDLMSIGKVDFVGFQKNPYKYIKHADCFVLPSRREGNPNVLHEAMYLQVPVAATRSVPIVGRIVTPDRGISVDVEDVDALAESMVALAGKKITKPYEYTDGREILLKLFS